LLAVFFADPVKEQTLNHPESSIRLRFVRALFQMLAKAPGKPPYFASPLAIGRPDGHL